MRRSLWFGLTTAAMLGWLALEPRTFAQNPKAPDEAGSSKLEQELVALALDLLRADALSDELKDEGRVLSTEPPGSDATGARFFRAPENVWKNAFPDQGPKDGQGDGVLEHLAGVQREIDKYQKDATKAWISATLQTLEQRKNRARTEGIIGWRMGSSAPGWGLSAALLGLGLLAVVGGLVLFAHENRDRIRWRLRARQPSQLDRRRDCASAVRGVLCLVGPWRGSRSASGEGGNSRGHRRARRRARG